MSIIQVLHVGPQGKAEKFISHSMGPETLLDTSDSVKIQEETHTYHSPPQTYPGCYGLPYQDHNYGAPPPPTPPQSPPPSPPPTKINGHAVDSEQDAVKEKALESITDTINEVLSSVVLEPEPAPQSIEEISADDNSVTRCICDYSHDDGYMICCDKCSVWQHIDCMGIDRNAIPDTFFCERCDPRPVDKERAREIQAKKREYLSDTSSSSETEIVTRYLDTSSGLGVIKKNGKKSKKRKREKENNSDAKTDIQKLYGFEVLTSELSKKKKKLKKDKKLKERSDLTSHFISGKLEKIKRRKLLKMKKQKENELNGGKMKKKLLKGKKLKNSMIVSNPFIFCEDANSPWERGDSDSFKYAEAKSNVYSSDIQEVLSSRRVNGTHTDNVDSKLGEKPLVQRCSVAQVRSNSMGLKAVEDLMYDQPVIEYRGNVMLREQFDKENVLSKKALPYVLFYSKLDGLDMCVDATAIGNDARFVRRSCSPNAEVRHIVENGKLHLLIFSTKEIIKGAEITIPFDFNYQGCNYRAECACSRMNCPVEKFFKKLDPKKENNKMNNLRPMKKRKKSKSLDTKVHESLIEDPPHPNILHSDSSSAAGPAQSSKKRVAPLQQSTNANITVETTATTVVKQPIAPPQPPPPTNSDENSNIEIEVDGPAPAPDLPEPAEEAEPPTTTEEEISVADSKKKTREERKMEAIMKAFEKLEKREERRKEALARLEHTKKKEPPVTSDSEKEEKATPPKAVKEKVKVKEEVEEPVEVVPVEPQVKEEVSTVPETKETPEVKVEKPKPKGKKGKKCSLAPARRKSRMSSHNSEAFTSTDESSNPSTASSTPLSVDPALNPFNQAFKFPKTKKHLMNEWLTEKGQDACKPLTIKTDSLDLPPDDTMYVKCLPSPHNTLSHLRRNSATCSTVTTASVPKTTNMLGTSMGSAKKRWLRQAMFETDSEPSTPVPNGSLSPNPGFTSNTPSTIPIADFVTPLKKRRLAWRESEDGSFPPTPSTPSSEFASPLDMPGVINRSMSLDESKLRNGYNRIAFSPMTPSTPGDGLFERIGALSSSTDTPSYGKQESLESDVSDSILSPVRDHFTGESDSEIAISLADRAKHSVSSCINEDNEASCSGVTENNDAAVVIAVRNQIDECCHNDPGSAVCNNLLSSRGSANSGQEHCEECDTSVRTEDDVQCMNADVTLNEPLASGAVTNKNTRTMEACGSKHSDDLDTDPQVDSTPSEPSVQNVLADSNVELIAGENMDTNCESSESAADCVASLPHVTNSDDNNTGAADSTENKTVDLHQVMEASSEQAVSCSNGVSGTSSSNPEAVDVEMDSTQPEPESGGQKFHRSGQTKKDDDNVSSSSSSESLEEGEICDSEEECIAAQASNSQIPESQGFEINTSDSPNILMENNVATSSIHDTACKTDFDPDQSQDHAPISLVADSTSGLSTRKDCGLTTSSVTSSTVSDTEGPMETNSQVSTTDNCADNTQFCSVDTASSSTSIGSSATSHISSSHSSLPLTSVTADSSPTNSIIGSSSSPTSFQSMTNNGGGVGSSTLLPLRFAPTSNSALPSASSGSVTSCSTSSSSSLNAPQKKKVSLLEYRKRMREKSTSSSHSGSACTTPTKTPTSVTYHTSPRANTPSSTPLLAPLPLFDSPSPGPDLDLSPFRGSRKEENVDSKWSQPTSVERVREQSLAERLKREFGVDASDDEEDKKSETPNSSEILKTVNPEVLKAVAAVFKGAMAPSIPPSQAPIPQPVPPPLPLPSSVVGNGSNTILPRPPSQQPTAKIPSLMSLQTFPPQQSGNSQTQHANFQNSGGPTQSGQFPQATSFSQNQAPPPFNQQPQGSFQSPTQPPRPVPPPAGFNSAVPSGSGFNPSTPPTNFQSAQPFNQNQTFAQPPQNLNNTALQPQPEPSFQGPNFPAHFPQGQFGPNNFNHPSAQQTLPSGSGQFGQNNAPMPSQNGQGAPSQSQQGFPFPQTFNSFGYQQQQQDQQQQPTSTSQPKQKHSPNFQRKYKNSGYAKDRPYFN